MTVRRSIKSLIYQEAARILPARLSVPLQFILHHGHLPNIAHPKTFSEKIQRLKFQTPTAEMIRLTNKVTAKSVVEAELGSSWVVPTLWYGEKLPPVEDRTWPIPFVIKASHGSGWNKFVRKPEDLVWGEIERAAQIWMDNPWREFQHETWYNAMPRYILVEPYIGELAEFPYDYRFFTFNGSVEYIAVDTGTNVSVKRVFFDKSWSRMDFRVKHPMETAEIPKPKYLEEMIHAAEKLSGAFEFSRVDFYELSSGPKFGEITFAPGSGYQRFYPKEMDATFGKLWRSAHTH